MAVKTKIALAVAGVVLVGGVIVGVVSLNSSEADAYIPIETTAPTEAVQTAPATVAVTTFATPAVTAETEPMTELEPVATDEGTEPEIVTLSNPQTTSQAPPPQATQAPPRTRAPVAQSPNTPQSDRCSLAMAGVVQGRCECSHCFPIWDGLSWETETRSTLNSGGVPWSTRLEESHGIGSRINFYQSWRFVGGDTNIPNKIQSVQNGTVVIPFDRNSEYYPIYEEAYRLLQSGFSSENFNTRAERVFTGRFDDGRTTPYLTEQGAIYQAALNIISWILDPCDSISGAVRVLSRGEPRIVTHEQHNGRLFRESSFPIIATVNHQAGCGGAMSAETRRQFDEYLRETGMYDWYHAR
jgi:hypothetical protein